MDICKRKNICIIGKNSKVAKEIKKSNLKDSYNFTSVSLRDYNLKFRTQLKKSECIIYTIADTRTSIVEDEYSDYFYSNILLLFKFVIDNINLLKNKKFIFLSSAKVYNIVEQNDLNETIDYDDVHSSHQLRNIVHELENLLTTRNQCDFSYVEELFFKLPKIDEYFPIYEYSKIICEMYISKKLKNYHILRPTYLYGQEDNNLVFSMVKEAFNNHRVVLTNSSKDFVPYSYLLKIIKHIINDNMIKKSAINIATGFMVSLELLEFYIKIIEDLINKEINVEIDNKKITKNTKIPFGKILSIIGEENFSTYIFKDEIRKIIYYNFLTIEKKYTIQEELIGGSFACVYKVKNQKNETMLVKVSLGNGANNGNIKLKNEIKQLETMNAFLQDKLDKQITPTIIDSFVTDNFTYVCSTFISGEKFYKPTLCLCNAIEFTEKLCENICKVYSLSNHKIFENMVLKNNMRVTDRLQSVKHKRLKIDRAFYYVFDYDHITINDEIYRNPIDLLNEFTKFSNISFLNQMGPCISGDPILDNCIYSNNEMFIIDPRGEDLLWINNVPFFDSLYDFGKILFYFLGWKLIREEQYTLKCNSFDLSEGTVCEFKFTSELNKVFFEMSMCCKNIFLQCKPMLKNKDTDFEYLIKILYYAGLHFLSDTYPRIVGKGNQLSECMAEYLLGTLIINKVYNILKKGQKSLDFQIGDIYE